MISDRAKQLNESVTLKMARLSSELRAQGKEIVNMTLGEPDFLMPSEVKSAAKDAIDNNFSKYTPVPGFPGVREAVARKLQNENGLDVSASQVVVSTGAKQSLMNIIMALVNPGDTVLLFAPYWVSYKDMVEFVGGKVKVLHSTVENGYKVSSQDLREVLTDDVKLAIFNNPSNPSGAVYTSDEVKELANEFSQKETIVISDEIYEHINYEKRPASLGTFIPQKTFTVNGLSKYFAMTGWRVGYMAAPTDELAFVCSKIQGQFTSAANSISQKACVKALELDPTSLQKNVDELKEKRNLMISRLKEIPGIGLYEPQGAFYLLPDFSSFVGKEISGSEIKSVEDLCLRLLTEMNLASVPGSAFGTPNAIRFSFATTFEQIEKACQKLKDFLTGS